MHRRTNQVAGAILLFSCSVANSWEPTQEHATGVTLRYELFAPFGPTGIEISTNNLGFIDKFQLNSDVRFLEIPPEDLSGFRHPSLADVEVMHYGEEDRESGLGGNFSICVPYGPISRLDNERYWQRAVFYVQVFPDKEIVEVLPLPEEGVLNMGPNGCEIAAQEVYGF